MQGLVQQAVGQDWRPLPQALHKAAAFQESVHNLVFDVLMDKVCPPAVSLCSHPAESPDPHTQFGHVNLVLQQAGQNCDLDLHSTLLGPLRK